MDVFEEITRLRRAGIKVALATITVLVAASVSQQGGSPSGGTVQVIAIDPRSTNTVYAGTSGGIFKSTNGGANWTPINSGLTNNDLRALAIDPTKTTTVYAGTLGGGVFKSTDGGSNWTAIVSGLPGTRSSLAAPPTPASGVKGTSVLALAIDPSHSSTIYAVVAGTIGGISRDVGRIFKSTDGGATWTSSNTGLEGCTLFPSDRNPSFATLCSPSVKGLPDTYVESLAIDPTTPATLYAGTVPGGVFKSTDGGANWSSVNFTDAGTDIEALAIDPRNSGVVYAVAANNILRQAGPGGGNLPHNQLKGTNNGIFKTTDGGTTWTAVNLGLPTSSFTGVGGSLANSIEVKAVAIEPSNPSTLYSVVVENNTAGVFKSTNGAGNWVPTSLPAPIVNALAIDRSAPATIYVGTTAGVFKSADGGGTWQPTGSL